MSEAGFPTSWRSPDYIAAVIGTVATGALFYYSALVESAPSSETIFLVLLWVLIPSTVAYEGARRFL